MKKRLFLSLLALLLFGATLFIRLENLSGIGAQPSESAWIKDSLELVRKARVNPWEATDHLVAPGVPPALFMSVGICARAKYHFVNGITEGDPEYLSVYDVARASSIIVSSLLVPLILLLG